MAIDIELRKKIETHKAKVGVLGLGYVGLPLVMAFHNVGFPVLGFDLDRNKVDQLKAGKSYLKHIDDSVIEELMDSGAFDATDDFSRLGECDALLICVPTPLSENREPDLSYVLDTAKQIAATLRPGQLVALESTTYPGTTDEELLPILEQGGLQVGKDFFLAFSPEREDPGNPAFSTRSIPKIMGGVTKTCGDLTESLYRQAIDHIVRVGSTREAEMTKLFENIFRSVNIALVNELKILCDRMNIDVWQVIEAASTKPFGFMPFYPGPGLGGHCIPIDPFYLTWKAREYQITTRFIELAGEINAAMPEYVIRRTMEALNERKKSLNGSKVLVLGVAYKQDVDDMRESPSLVLIDLLREKGAKVEYNDPHIPKLPPTRKYEFNLKSKALTEKKLASVDAVLIATAHSAYDYDFIVRHAPLVIDTRNATRRVKHGHKKIVRA